MNGVGARTDFGWRVGTELEVAVKGLTVAKGATVAGVATTVAVMTEVVGVVGMSPIRESNR